jgi:hypothetical protein
MSDTQSIDISRLAQETIHAFNHADWERFHAWMASDVVYVEVGTGRRVEGCKEAPKQHNSHHASAPIALRRAPALTCDTLIIRH